MENKVTIKSYKRNWNARANSYKVIKSRIPTAEALPKKKARVQALGKATAKYLILFEFFLKLEKLTV